jgi:hypothetical protein
MAAVHPAVGLLRHLRGALGHAALAGRQSCGAGSGQSLAKGGSN